SIPEEDDEDQESQEVLDLSPLDAMLKELKGRKGVELTDQQLQTMARLASHGHSNALQPLVEATNQSTLQIINDIKLLTASTHEILSSLQVSESPDRSAPRVDPATARMQELLWWGQARYSHLARQPFRRIAEP